MKNWIVLSLLVLIFAGCSSGEKRTERASETSAKSRDAKGSKEKLAEKDLYPLLSEAIKTQNDAQVNQVAGQILGQNPNDIKTLNALGVYHYTRGRTDLAKMILSRAIAHNGKVSELYSNLGVVQLSEGEKREAMRSFRKALDLNSSDGVAASNLGALYVMAQDYKKALPVLETAYRRGPKDYRTLNNYAVALVATGNGKKARGLYEEALQGQPNNKEILLNYAILLVDHLNDYREGMNIIDRVRFSGVGPESRDTINALENKAKTGLNSK